MICSTMKANPAAVETPAPKQVGVSYPVGFHERRREARYPTNDPAKVEIWQPPMLTVPATILDISRSGLRLALETRMGKGVQVKITLECPMVVFGEVRHCRSVGSGFQAGIEIREVVYLRDGPASHVDDDSLEFYLIGRGLTTADVIKLRDHLIQCESCRTRLGEKDSILNPRKRRLQA